MDQGLLSTLHRSLRALRRLEVAQSSGSSLAVKDLCEGARNVCDSATNTRASWPSMRNGMFESTSARRAQGDAGHIVRRSDGDLSPDPRNCLGRLASDTPYCRPTYAHDVAWLVLRTLRCEWGHRSE